MESLESKLDRLTPRQRKEVGDFVDFLLSQSGLQSVPDASCSPPPLLDVAPPLLVPIEPAHVITETRTAGLHDPAADGRSDPAAGEEATAVPFHEVSGGIQDQLTHDSMDYGQFEIHPSPATEAVKKVKRRIIARQGQEKPRHLLDWVD